MFMKIISQLTLKPFFWIVLITFFFSYPLIRTYFRKLPDSPPILYPIEWSKQSLTSQYSKNYSLNEFKGRFLIVNFFFKRCPTICHVLLLKTQEIQKKIRGLGDKVAILSITVDPDNDTPAELAHLAKSLKANRLIWYFLTAPLDDTKKLIIEQFKAPLDQSNILDIAHSQSFYLVDSNGKMRGTYSSSKEGVLKLMIDLGLLVNREFYLK